MADAVFVLTILIIAIALVFDYVNGFHDAANSIATIVSTRVLTPLQGVAWAAFWNFIAAFTFGTAVAKTVGIGLLDVQQIDSYVILAALAGRYHLGPDYVVRRPANKLVTRAHRRVCRCGHRQSRPGCHYSRGLDQHAYYLSSWRHCWGWRWECSIWC